MSGCPKCGETFTESVTAAVFAIEHGDAVQERTCGVATTEGGEPAVTIYYHTADDLAANEPFVGDDEEVVEVADPSELTGDDRTVYRVIQEATQTDAAITRGELAGKAASIASIGPTEAREIADDLLDGGYIEETASGVYKTRDENEVAA